MPELSIILSEIELVARGFEELLDDVVFVGGAMVPFYLDAPEKETLRATEDIDVVLAIASYVEYAKLEQRLVKKGFQPDLESKVAVRKKFLGIAVDVMPSEGSVWGFSNKWYPAGIAASKKVELPQGTRIRIFTLPYFLASKFEAHTDRAESIDCSKDLEDILLVFHGCSTIKTEVQASSKEIVHYLAKEAQALLLLPELDFRQLCDSYRVSNARIRQVCESLLACAKVAPQRKTTLRRY